MDRIHASGVDGGGFCFVHEGQDSGTPSSQRAIEREADFCEMNARKPSTKLRLQTRRRHGKNLRLIHVEGRDLEEGEGGGEFRRQSSNHKLVEFRSPSLDGTMEEMNATGPSLMQ